MRRDGTKAVAGKRGGLRERPAQAETASQGDGAPGIIYFLLAPQRIPSGAFVWQRRRLAFSSDLPTGIHGGGFRYINCMPIIKICGIGISIPEIGHSGRPTGRRSIGN